MWHYSAGTKQQLQPQLFEQIGKYRREVFINQLGWQLRAIDGMELDEFDSPEAVYVCSHDDEGRVSGVARLLPTTSPYLMEKVFPQLWAGKVLPRDAQIWELSRFAAVMPSSNRQLAHQASAKHASTLLRRVMHTTSLLGANTLITVSPIGMERLLRLSGFRAMRAGAPMVNHGESIVGLQIECPIDYRLVENAD